MGRRQVFLGLSSLHLTVSEKKKDVLLEYPSLFLVMIPILYFDEFFFSLNFNNEYVCMSVCGHVHVSASAYGSQKRALDFMELKW